MHSKTEKEFDETFDLHGWPMAKLKFFISTHLIDKRVLVEQIKDMEREEHACITDDEMVWHKKGYDVAVQEFKEKLLTSRKN